VVVEKTFSDSQRRSKALKRALLVTMIVSLPVAYFAYIYLSFGRVELQQLGKVEPFEYINEVSLFSQVDLIRRVSVVANLKACGACSEEIKKLAELKSWIYQTIVNPNPRDTRPDDAMIVILYPSGEELDPLALEVTHKIYSVGESQDFLSPLRSNESDLVAISQDGFYVYRQDFDTPWASLHNILQRITSETYLLQYLHEQALMWKKSRG
jgi:hypothetical protein